LTALYFALPALNLYRIVRLRVTLFLFCFFLLFCAAKSFVVEVCCTQYCGLSFISTSHERGAECNFIQHRYSDLGSVNTRVYDAFDAATAARLVPTGLTDGAAIKPAALLQSDRADL
jgi:hypothetical protein